MNLLISIFSHIVAIIFSEIGITLLGGLGGFSLELTDWLIFRGARNVVLISKNGIKTVTVINVKIRL